MNSKEALKQLSKKINDYADCLRYSDKKKEEINNLIKVISDDLDKLQKDRKIKDFIKILKKSLVSLKLMGDLKTYTIRNNIAIDNYATDEDYELIQEVLECC
jgi:hypothetical protein